MYHIAHQNIVCQLASLFAVVTLLTSILCADQPDLGALEEKAFKEAAAFADPSVVRIQTVGGLDRVGRVLTGTGPTTGVVVSADGYIISSSFNFASRPTSILVQLSDGRQLPAKIVASDKAKMLTLIKIDEKDMTPATAARKDDIKVGQWALAMGRTYDNEIPSVSVGIVSALNRVYGKALQTDAKVSPVNYGGPLVDIRGHAMGVLVPLSTRGSGETAGVEWYDSGIGFAIPMEEVYASLDRLKRGVDLKSGRIGIDLKGRGLLAGEAEINRVRENSPAKAAGLEKGDVIIEADGKKIGRQAELRHALGNKYAGDSLTLVVRRGKEELTKKLILVADLEAYESAFLGILPRRIDLQEAADLQGVGVRYVFTKSAAAEAGLQTRDRIIKFQNEQIEDESQLLDLVGRTRPGEEISIEFLRGDEKKTAKIKLTSIPNQVPADLRTWPIPVPVPSSEDNEDATDGGAEESEKIATGRLQREMAAHEHSYWAYIPEGYNPNHLYGLMVWLHPGGDTMEATIYREWKSICNQRGIIILAPKAENLNGWNLNEADFINAAVGEIQEEYSIDPTRIFLHTFSDGGRMAFHLAFRDRDVYRGVAAVTSPVRVRPEENEADHRLQFHFVVGDQDANLEAVNQSVEGLRQMKYPANLSTVQGGEYRYPPAEQVQEIGRWADALDRI